MGYSPAEVFMSSELLVPELVQVGTTQSNPTRKIVVAISGDDLFLNYEDYGLSFDSSESDILARINPIIQEQFGQSLESGGRWTYKTRKATASQNVYIIPNSTAGSESLSVMADKDRLAIYETITKGCMHLWSKGKLQEDRLKPVLESFAVLAEKDPIFLAHFTSYAVRKLDAKDLKVVATFASSLSDADGTPFSPGSAYTKPNLRVVAAAALQELDPKLALRVLELAASKRAFGAKPVATHFSKHIRTAAHKYLRFREANPKSLEGLRKAGLRSTVKGIYHLSHLAPSKEACQTFAWKQKAGYPGAGVELQKALSFEGLSDLEIARKIQTEKLSPLVALGALPKMTPVAAAAILEQCSGDQAVVLTDMLEREGLLKIPTVMKLYQEKIATAKTALDRVERIQTQLNEQTKQVLREAKSEKRKDDVGEFGKMFLHLDVSGSMDQALEVAKDRGAILAECVKNPQENFFWGTFNTSGKQLPTPKTFEKDAFKAALYGIRCDGGTDVVANWETARKLGCDVDVYVTDEGHNGRDIKTVVTNGRKAGFADPKTIIIISIGGNKSLKRVFEDLGIPVTYIEPNHLTESALVSQAVKTSVKGAIALIEEIMNFPLLSLPKWYESVKA
jgi:hypothetical protein